MRTRILVADGFTVAAVHSMLAREADFHVLEAGDLAKAVAR